MLEIDQLLFYEIMYFLQNDALMKVEITNKKIRERLKEKQFRRKILNRRHPLMFNIYDNYCRICNFMEFTAYVRNGGYNPLLIENCMHQ
tara:strand:+ start:415 stop:681 length:267 start_codon:yes stop_codon:yes gene_type:complete